MTSAMLSRVLAVAVGVLAIAPAVPAQGYRSAGGDGDGAADAATFDAATITAPASSSGVTTVTWADEAQLPRTPRPAR